MAGPRLAHLFTCLLFNQCKNHTNQSEHFKKSAVKVHSVFGPSCTAVLLDETPLCRLSRLAHSHSTACDDMLWSDSIQGRCDWPTPCAQNPLRHNPAFFAAIRGPVRVGIPPRGSDRVRSTG